MKKILKELLIQIKFKDVIFFDHKIIEYGNSSFRFNEVTKK